MSWDEAIAILQAMADRWNQTVEWHNPPFHDGTIKVTTRELHAAAVLLERLGHGT